MNADVVIVGGGVIGLSIAYVLATEGTRVTVLDRDAMGRAASWAGAGIISPGSIRPTDDPLTALRTLSARLHEEWAERLRAETTIDNGYRRCGGLDVAVTPEEDAHLVDLSRRWADEGIAHERLDAVGIKAFEPGITSQVVGGYHLPGRAQIRNPRHLKALVEACEGRGVDLRPGCEVTSLIRDGGRISGVETTQGVIPCGWMVLAAGPWTEAVARTAGIDVATPPVKGQIVLFHSPEPLLSKIVEHGANYLVPRDDGHILMGATEENAGFDIRPTQAAAHELISQGIRLLPTLETAQIVTTWAGLRPGNLDGLPTIGPVPGFENVILATGHRRAGLQLSPGTAELVADLILGRPLPFDLRPFRPGRKPSKSVDDAFRS